MPRVFLSYRRADSEAAAGRLFDRLRDHFGVDNVFRDLDTLLPGDKFAQVISQNIAQCDALLVVIGKEWLNATDADGQRRLADANDFVRAEIREALGLDKTVIPVLIEDATIPKEGELPGDISSLAGRNPIEISDSRFDYDVGRLISTLDPTALGKLAQPKGWWNRIGKELFADIKSDLLKSIVTGGVGIFVAAVLSSLSEAIPTEFKQPAIIILIGAVIALFSLALILLIRYRTSVKLIITLLSLIIAVAIMSFFAFTKYTWKGLPLTTDNPIFIVFYPEHVSSTALQTNIESSIRELGGALKDSQGSYQIKKIALPQNFDFDHSLLRKHVDQSTYVISYVRLIPEGDRVFIKHGFPASLPYLNMGFETVKNTSYSDNLGLSVEFEGRFQYFSINLDLYSNYSKIHYGVPNSNLSLGFGIKGNKISRSELSKSPLTPVSGGQLVEPTALSGNIYFSLVSGLVNYYKLIGESETGCRLLEDYLDFGQDDNVKKNLTFLPQKDLLGCLIEFSLEDKQWLFKVLPVDQVETLQQDLFHQLIEGKKLQAYLVRIGLYEDITALDIADHIAKTCRKETGYQSPNSASVWNFAYCLEKQLSQDIEVVRQHPLLKNNGAEVVKELYDEWVKQNIFRYHSSTFLQYAERVPEMYRALEQKEKSCDFSWNLLGGAYVISAFKDLLKYWDIKLFFDTVMDDMEQTYRLSKCKQITVFGLDTHRLVLEREGRDALNKLTDDLLQDLKNDVVLSTLFSHIETNLLVIASYLESYEAQHIIKNWFNTIQRDLDKVVALEFGYLSQQFNVPKEIIRELPPDFGKKIMAHFHGLSLNDTSSRWRSAVYTMLEENSDIFGKVFYRLPLLKDYFLDPFARQIFAVFGTLINKTIIERNTSVIHNRTLDKMILFMNLQLPARDSSPIQLSQTFKILKNEHANSISDPRLKHYEFYVKFKNGETEKALAALDDLVALNEYPYADFYRFARSVLQSPNTISVCPGKPDTAKQILDHLLSRSFKSKYWLIQSKENAFSRELKGYLNQFILNEKKDYPELVALFQDCVATI